MGGAATQDRRPITELTRAVFGEELTMDELLVWGEPVLGVVGSGLAGLPSPEGLWIGSVGYERHKDHEAFARHLSEMGVERLVDVRELPMSRRRGYGKTALAAALAQAGVEYLHIKALGNPKRFRDLYKSGRVPEGRAGYERHLLGDGRGALEDLVPLLEEKRCALMCVEHDAQVCHRAVIVEALRRELGLQLDVAEIA